MESRKITILVLIDLSRAFDSVDTNLLLANLRTLNLSPINNLEHLLKRDAYNTCSNSLLLFRVSRAKLVEGGVGQEYLQQNLLKITGYECTEQIKLVLTRNRKIPLPWLCPTGLQIQTSSQEFPVPKKPHELMGVFDTEAKEEAHEREDKLDEEEHKEE
ncbi:hypothetical protein J437_LFUL006527 [Ladona fulva]|uniref:Uncharacterized protein n=1 Tax=Ladona fulva TaxID=123851 RepID=A0A8K0KG62_LADFU|nr:hypothetical protein J437_LFUL006527 [Ladona fulva]